MMYHKNVVAAIKVGGQVLRENGQEVQLPFGSEYSILVKNLNTVRIMARVEIDGENVTSGRWLVVEPNGDFELERIIRDSNLNKGNRFKFIERTESVEQHRGVRAEDGIVRIEVKKEFIYSWPPEWHPRYLYKQDTSRTIRSSVMRSSSVAGLDSSTYFLGHNMMCSAQSNEAGITVPGSISNQQFQDVMGFPTEAETDVIVLRLKGRSQSAKIEKPVTVKTRLVCVTCNRTNKSGSKYCSNCGTSLYIV